MNTGPIALALFAALALSAGLRQESRNSSGGELSPEQAAYDVLHYDLAIRVDPEQRTIAGTLTLRARIVETTPAIVLDLDGRLKVESVTSGEEPLAFDHAEGRIRIASPELFEEAGRELELTVAYGGTPREAPNPPWSGGFTWSETKAGQPWIATSCQHEGADLWWPCKDHPSDEPESMDIRVTVPEPLVVASNGRLEALEKAERGWHTYHWHVSTPINNYGVALNIAPYEAITKKFESVAGDSFDVTFWFLPENARQARKIFPEFIEHLEFYEQLCGPYAFRADKYGVAETPHLGMEHQSIIAYGNRYRRDRNFDYDWLHHHELAHEWWANLVTAPDWNDFWIHEGIGTYMQALYLERKFGTEAYHRKMSLDHERIINRGAVAPRDPRPTSRMYFAQEGSDSPGIDIYMKGSWIVHTLRWLLGDEDFFLVLRRWAYPTPELEKVTDGTQCRFATTDELLAIAEEHAGVELDWFFELYLRQPHLPELIAEKRGRELHLRWQTPGDLPFPLPVPVKVGRETHRVAMPNGEGRITVGNRSYEVDPEHWVLRKP